MADSYINDVFGYKTFCMEKLYELRDKTYFGIGRRTQWSDTEPENVPIVDTHTNISDLIALKKADEVAYAIPDENGTIEHLGQKYRITNSMSDVYSAASHYMYYKAKFEYSNMPLETFRQIGIYVGVEINGTPSSNGVCLPDKVSSLGKLIIVNNRAPVVRSSDQKEYVEFIVEI